MQNYRIVGRMGEGTFSEVLKCQSHLNGKLYACKKMKQKYDSIDQVNNLREIQALRRLNPHPNIIDLKEVIFDRRNNTLALICELMDMNIYELIKDRRSFLSEQKVQLYMYQLCKSIYHMHRNGIFHRDVKPENILIKDNVLKLADFGSCKSVYSKQPYTEYISTRWYRAPECLLTDGYYDHKMDMWSVGCVFFEVMTLRPLFPGSNELDQVAKIHEVVGTPSSSLLQKLKKHQSRHMEFNFPCKQGTGILPMFKHGSRGCVDLITRLCTYDPDLRLTAKQALRHPYFRDLREAERRAKQATRTPSISRDLVETRLLGKMKLNEQQAKQTRLPKLQHKSSHSQLAGISEHHKLGSGDADSQLQQHPHANGGLLPSLHSKPYQHHRTSGVTSSLMTSSKSTSHSSFLPSLQVYREKGGTTKHSIYPVGGSKDRKHQLPPHKFNPPHLPSITKHRTGAG